MTQRRYAQVGLGARSWLYSIGLTQWHADCCELVGLCDSNAGRLGHRVEAVRALGLEVPGYDAADYTRMLEACRPDVVIVTRPA